MCGAVKDRDNPEIPRQAVVANTDTCDMIYASVPPPTHISYCKYTTVQAEQQRVASEPRGTSLSATLQSTLGQRSKQSTAASRPDTTTECAHYLILCTILPEWGPE